jgi:hypothetical protein
MSAEGQTLVQRNFGLFSTHCLETVNKPYHGLQTLTPHQSEYLQQNVHTSFPTYSNPMAWFYITACSRSGYFTRDFNLPYIISGNIGKQ